MKRTIKIAIIAMMGISLRVNAQNIYPPDGNVGIGTSDPKAGLHIANNYRSFIAEGLFFLRNTEAPVDKKNWYFAAQDNGTLGLYTADDNYSWKKTILKIDSYTGNLGIGATSLSKRMHIKGSTNSYDQLLVEGGISAAIQLESKDNIGDRPVISANKGNFSIQTWRDRFNWKSTPFYINQYGNVGIGTTSPSKRMHIKGSTGSYDQLLVEGGVSAAIQLESKDNIGDRPVISGNNGNFSIQIWKDRSNWKSTPFYINQSGKIGIGTTTTGNHKLAVEGSIGAREIKVEAGTWSDFVFYDDYQLPTLTEVENHIKEKGHLKDIPSAKEVKKNGFFLGEMDAKLLQKIEELTLYTIKQEKSLRTQSSKIREQQKEIEELKKQNSKIQELEKLVKKLIGEKK